MNPERVVRHAYRRGPEVHILRGHTGWGGAIFWIEFTVGGVLFLVERDRGVAPSVEIGRADLSEYDIGDRRLREKLVSYSTLHLQFPEKFPSLPYKTFRNTMEFLRDRHDVIETWLSDGDLRTDAPWSP